MGKLVADGGRMGVDLVDNKLPSVGLLMTLPYRLAGHAWGGYAALGLVLSFGATLLLARAAGRAFGPNAGWTVLVAAALWLNFTPAVFGQLQLETIQVFFAAIAASAALNVLQEGNWADALLVGMATGLAMWAKPTAAAILPAIVAGTCFVPVWSWRRVMTILLAITVGVMIPLTICAAMLVHTGMVDSIPATLAQLRDYSTGSSGDLIDLCKPLIVLSALLLPVLLLGWAFRRDRIEASPPHRAMAVFVIGWLVMEVLAVISQRRMYAYHFLVLGPPAALLCGLIPRQLRVRALLVAFGPLILLSLALAVQLDLLPPDSTHAALAAAVTRHALPTDAVWMDDYAELLMETDRQPGSRVPLIFLFANSDSAPARFSRIILDDFRERRPKLIVLPVNVDRVIDLYRYHMVEIARYPARAEAFAAAMHAIDRYVRQHYEPVQTVGNCVLWERSSAVAKVE